MTSKPPETPIGLVLSGVAKEVGQAFDEALASVGGSRPSWLVLVSLKARPATNQRELAEAVGIRGATLTHHLDRMEADGLLTRRRDPNNRRVHQLELTELGEEAFHRMREAAVSFDRRLRDGIDNERIAVLRDVLETMRDNVAVPGDGSTGDDGTDPVCAGNRTPSEHD